MKLLLKPSRDVGLLDDLDAEIFPTDYIEDKVGNGLYWWVCWDGDIAAGFAGLNMLPDRVAYLNRAGVCEEYRGQGLQKRMIKVRERKARALGAEIVITYTVKDNYASINSLMHSGYQMFYPDWAWAGKDKFYFRKAL